MNKLITYMILCCFAMTSCNTIKRQPESNIFISSNPEGAQIEVDGYYCGTTPGVVGMDPRYSHEILLQKEGYFPEYYVIQSQVSGKKLANNLFLPVGGLLVGVGVGGAMLFSVGGSAVAQGLAVAVVAGVCLVGLAAGVGAGAIGTGVDLYTGKARTLSQEDVYLELTRS